MFMQTDTQMSHDRMFMQRVFGAENISSFPWKRCVNKPRHILYSGALIEIRVDNEAN